MTIYAYLEHSKNIGSLKCVHLKKEIWASQFFRQIIDFRHSNSEMTAIKIPNFRGDAKWHLFASMQPNLIRLFMWNWCINFLDIVIAKIIATAAYQHYFLLDLRENLINTDLCQGLIDYEVWSKFRTLVFEIWLSL